MKCAAVIISLLLFPSIVTAAERPNFVIIMADDLGYGDLSCYDGWISTPHLDRLANEGLRFTDFHSNGAVCSPTRAALVTGRYPQRVGIPSVIVARRDAKQHLNGLKAEETTFAEALAEHGYVSGVFGKWHLGYYPRFNPVRHGFNVFKGYVSGNVDFISHIDQAGHEDWWHDDSLTKEDGYVTHLITQHAVSFIDENQSRPFCLYLPHEAPHYPYQGPRDKADRTVGGQFPNHGSRADKKSAYEEMVVEMDRGIGEIMAKLRECELEDRTLVFFCSDNGATKLGSNGQLRGNKGSAWEGGHRVPAIARWPGRISPGISAETQMTMDLMPTMLGLAAPNHDANDGSFDGVNLAEHWLRQRPLSSRTVFWDTGKSQAVRDGIWKLVINADRTPHLFRLDIDASESNNVAMENPQRVDEMRNALRSWNSAVTPNGDAR